MRIRSVHFIDFDEGDPARVVHIRHDGAVGTAQGRRWFSQSFEQLRLDRMRDPDSFTKKLSDYEQLMLTHIGEGLDDEEVGQRVGIAARTVQGHRSTIMRKLNIPGTPKLIAYAIAKGFTRLADWKRERERPHRN